MNQATQFLTNLLKPADTIVLAISGGPDSMYLAHLLLKLKDKLGLKIILAHVNHGLREQSAEEEQFLRDFAKENKLAFEYLKIEKYSKDNFHAEARKIRYQFFFETVLKYQANYLMTAHHGDDLMETILMRLTRGASLNGYSGIKLITKKDNFKIVRPLLYLTKNEIKNYLDAENLPYYIDDSNSKDKYTRNRYRKYLLPFLKKENPGVHLKYLEFSQEIDEANQYLIKQVLKVIDDIYQDNTVNIKMLLKEDPYLQKKIIEEIFHILYKDDLNLITKKHYQALFNLINSNTNTYITLPHNIIALKEYNSIRFTVSPKENIENYSFKLDNEVILANGDKILKVKDATKTDNYHLYLDSNEVVLPLIVRNRQGQDKMAVKNLNGHQKIKDILINAKIPKSIRDAYPIVSDSAGNILWVPGIKKSQFDKAKTKNYDIILKYVKKEGE